MASPDTKPPIVGVLDELPGSPQSPLFIPVFLLAVFGVNLATLSAAGIGIPLRFGSLDPAHKATLLSITIAVGGVITMIATPPLGRLSDHSTSRHGIRRPYLLWGTILGVVGLMTMAVATNAVVIVVGWCITALGFSAPLMALNSLMADQIPRRIRARVAAFFGMCNGLGQLAGGYLIGALPGSPIWWFGVPALLTLALNVALVLVLRDIKRTERTPIGWRPMLSSYWLNPVRHPDFAFAWLCRLLVTMGMVSVILFLLYFLTDDLHVPVADAPTLVSTAVAAYFVASIVTTLVFAWISDRTGRRKAIVGASAALSSVGLLFIAVAPSLPVFFAGIVTAGLGQGAYIAVDVAMMTEVLPSADEAGKNLGIVALSYQLPQLLVPVIAVPLLSFGGTSNYRALYVTAVIMVLLGALAVLPIKKIR
jgi:MFS family permease